MAVRERYEMDADKIPELEVENHNRFIEKKEKAWQTNMRPRKKSGPPNRNEWNIMPVHWD